MYIFCKLYVQIDKSFLGFTPDMNMIVTNSFTGEDRDLTGTLLSIDSQEGVVKLNPSGDVKMLQLKYLCKMKTD